MRRGGRWDESGEVVKIVLTLGGKSPRGCRESEERKEDGEERRGREERAER